MLIKKKKMVELKIILNTLAHKQNLELKLTKKSTRARMPIFRRLGQEDTNKVKASLDYTANSRSGWATE